METRELCASSSLAPRQLVASLGRSSGGAFGAACPNDLPRGSQQARNCARNVDTPSRTPIHSNKLSFQVEGEGIAQKSIKSRNFQCKIAYFEQILTKIALSKHKTR